MRIRVEKAKPGDDLYAALETIDYLFQFLPQLDDERDQAALDCLPYEGRDRLISYIARTHPVFPENRVESPDD